MSLQASDFFGYYPSIKDPLFNSEIARRQEYAELPSLPTEPIPPIGEGFNHQRFAVRYAEHYDRCVFIHDPGTGKSCIITHIAEMFKNNYLKDPNDPTKIKRAIIVTSDTLLGVIRDEIVCKCTDKVYFNKAVAGANTDKSRKAAFTKALKEWYSIETYNTFSKRIKKNRSLEDFIAENEHTAILIDEAHDLATDHDKKASGEGVFEAMMEKEGDDLDTYEAIFKILHVLKHISVYIFTATPMKNDPTDLIYVMNLVLPMDELIPAYTNSEFNNLTFEDMVKYLRGRVSYVRSPVTGSTEDYQGEVFVSELEDAVDKEPVKVTIYQNVMTGIQLETYQDIESGHFDSNGRHIGYIVFPDGSYGSQGHDKYVKTGRGNTFEFKTDEHGDEFKRRIRNLDSLRELSVKFAEVVDICQKAYVTDASIEIDDDKGIIFVYFPDYIEGGAAEFSLVLKSFGYTQYTSTASAFKTKHVAGFNPCVSTTQTGDIVINKAKRFILLTGKTTYSSQDVSLQLLNSFENRYGEYIQVVIGSKASGTGISILNAVYVFMMGSEWHTAGNKQAKDRVFRVNSRIQRLQEKRKRLGDPNATFPVKVYNMAAVTELGDYENSIDVKIFVKAARKDVRIAKFMRMIKMAAIDCYLNGKRNKNRPGDIDYTASCDYIVCDYPCDGIDRDLIKQRLTASKFVEYSGKDVFLAIERVKRIFRDKSSYSIKEVYRLVNSIRFVERGSRSASKYVSAPIEAKYVNVALNKIIEENIVILDRFGFNSFLREGANNSLYLERDPYSLKNSAETAYYNTVLIRAQEKKSDPFTDYANNIHLIEDNAKVEILREASDEDFNAILNDLSLIKKIDLIEEGILQLKQTGLVDDFHKRVIGVYQRNIYSMREPTDLLNKVKIKLSQLGTKRGKTPSMNSNALRTLYTNMKFPMFNVNYSDSWVYFHTMFNNAADDRTVHSKKPRYKKAQGLIRILRMNDNLGWRDVTEHEYIVYRKFAEATFSVIEQHFSKFKVYGQKMPYSDHMEIVDKDRERTNKSKGMRANYSGRQCKNWDKMSLYRLFYRLDERMLPPTESQFPYRKIDEAVEYEGMDFIDGAIKELRESEKGINEAELIELTLNELKFILAWKRSSLKKRELCEMLEAHFIENGKLLDGREIPTRGDTQFHVGNYNSAPPLEVETGVEDVIETEEAAQEEDLFMESQLDVYYTEDGEVAEGEELESDELLPDDDELYYGEINENDGVTYPS